VVVVGILGMENEEERSIVVKVQSSILVRSLEWVLALVQALVI